MKYGEQGPPYLYQVDCKAVCTLTRIFIIGREKKAGAVDRLPFLGDKMLLLCYLIFAVVVNLDQCIQKAGPVSCRLKVFICTFSPEARNAVGDNLLILWYVSESLFDLSRRDIERALEHTVHCFVSIPDIKNDDLRSAFFSYCLELLYGDLSGSRLRHIGNGCAGDPLFDVAAILCPYINAAVQDGCVLITQFLTVLNDVTSSLSA